MRYLSVCSGIEAATVAWHPLGWEPVAFAEIDPFPSAVLKYHYPDVPNLGDITHFEEWPYLGPVDLVCGGTPCQAFSVAGLRQGLADPRGNLTLTYLAILNRLQPRWFVFENVPGLLSHNKGRTFAAVLWAMGQLGYGWCYRVLDAQYVRVDGFLRAVPQRRRRLFIVGYLGDWRRAAAVLSEPEGMLGYTPPRRAPKQDLANTIAPALCAGGNRTGGTRPPGTDGDTMLSLIPDVSNAFAARDYKQPRAEDNVGLIPSAMMLAVRGRGDGRDLEVSDDGVANAHGRRRDRLQPQRRILPAAG
jgi:DNA (cytosine-5)-methyltransferase 1